MKLNTMKQSISLLFVLCIFLYVTTGFAQNENFAFKHLTTENGLSNSNINCIFQDSKGFIWIGTDDGLNRFDGYDFVVYKNKSSEIHSLSSNYIVAIYEDSDNNLWIGTAFGLNLFDRKLNRFVKFLHDPNDEYSIGNNYISHIIEKNGSVWVSTIGGGISKYDKKSNKFINYQHDNKQLNSLSSNIVKTMFKDSKNRLWLGTEFFGLNLFDASTETFTQYKDTVNASVNVIECIYEISENEFFLGTTAGLVRFFPDRKTNNFVLYKHDDNVERSISKGEIKKIFKDSWGNLWIAAQYGLSIYDPELDNFQHLKSDKSNNLSISTDETWDIMQDNQGILWFGTFKGGVNMLNFEQKHFVNWTYNPRDPKSLVNSSVLSFAENTDGTLWIGIDHGGLSLFDRHKGTIKSYKHKQNDRRSLSSDGVLSLFVDSKKQLWTGSWAGGMTMFDSVKEQFIPYVPSAKSINEWHIWDILEDSKSRIWATSFTGVFYYDTKNNRFSTFKSDKTKENDLSSKIVWCMLEDSQKNIWFGASVGLYKYNEKNNDFIYYQYITTDKKVVSYNVSSLCEDKFNRLWVGITENGICRFDRETKCFKSVKKNEGFANNSILGILEDDNGSFWISTNKGIIKTTIDENDSIVEFYNYDKKNGLQDDQFNNGASFKSMSGEMFFGSANGFVFFNPDSIKPNRYKPKVFITELRIFNKKAIVDPEGITDSPLKKEITETAEIVLTHKQSIFSLKFAALSYISTQRNQYAYKLEGLEDTWNYVQHKRDASYTNLDAGEYTFRVKASNNDGLWNENDTKLKITILPPWWNTWWFKALVIISIIGGAVSFYKIRINAIKAQKIILEKTVQERTAALQELNVTLEERQEEISQQADELEETNSQLANTNNELSDKNQHIKGSITYAQKLQKAILPIKDEMDKYFDNFILYRPKDIVSGDFYWFHIVPEDTSELEKHNPRILVAAVDCTGHGVPGAIMSMIGNNLLNEAVSYKRLSSPADILNHLDTGILKALKQEKTKNDDGMDVCLCLIEKLESSQSESSQPESTQPESLPFKVTFCGAKRPLIYYKSDVDEQHTIKGNVKSIGGTYTDKLTFTNEEIILHKNDVLYLTSDGYVDQCNKQRKSIGSKKLKMLLKENVKLPMNQQKTKLEDALDEHKNNTKQRDDITILGIQL